MKKKKEPFYDDGRTIADMNVEGMPWYNPNRTEKKDKNSKDNPTRREKRAMIWGAYKAHLPVLLVSICSFSLVAVLLYLWLQ
ncbi:MAG: hypothetical protein IKC47_05595 [Clostridia bacterium]|nr:hypothetical protein [Clostridia bacterium]